MYYLMNRDRRLLAFYIEKRGGIEVCVEDARLSHRMPPDYESGGLDSWIRLRFRAGQRRHLNAWVESENRETPSRFIALTRGLSLFDTLWIKEDGSDLTWEDVSLYRNPFDTAVSSFAFGSGDVPENSAGGGMPELTTGGKFYKSWERDEEGIWLLKNGKADDGRMALMGREPYGEVLASQVFEKLVPDACAYTLVERDGMVASRCRLFTSEEEGLQAFATYVRRDTTLYNILSYFDEIGSGDMFRRMVIADCITFNADRHTDNFGYLVDNRTWEKKRMSPPYDLNLCFFPYLSEDQLTNLDEYLSRHTSALGYDYVEPAQNFLSDQIRAELVNLKDLELSIPCDDFFTEKRLAMVNEMKNVQIDRILGEHRSFSFAGGKKRGLFSWPFGKKKSGKN